MAKNNGGNFKIRSVNVGGVGLIIVERINKKYVRENAHLATERNDDSDIVVFNASGGAFLTVAGERIIVRNNI